MYCDGSVILIDGEKIGNPFTIKAIGNSEVIYGALNRNKGYISTLKKDGIEINMNADQIVNEYLREKNKNSELEELLENSISKDIVQEMIAERKFILQQNYEEFENDIELKTLIKVLGMEQ